MTSSSAHKETRPGPRYSVRTADLPLSALEYRTHPVVSANHRYQVSLGDSTGLSKTAVHYCRLPAGATSTTLHWHSHDDEWMYILDAGEGAVMLIWEGGEGEIVPREEAIKTGDFFGFKAGVERAHAFRAGTTEMVYILGGSREPLDVTHYPEEGKRMVIDNAVGGISWTVDDKDVKASKRIAPRPVDQQ